MQRLPAFLHGSQPDSQFLLWLTKTMSVSRKHGHSPQNKSTMAVQEERVDETMDISQREAEGTMRALARVEGIFAGPSSGGAVSAALRLSAKLTNATIVAIICDRGDRYLSTGMLSHAICLLCILLAWLKPVLYLYSPVNRFACCLATANSDSLG